MSQMEFHYPVEQFWISQGCVPGQHTAIDFAVINNTKVMASESGVVEKTYDGYDYNGGTSYGNYIELCHGEDVDGISWWTIYAHLAPGLLVKVGDLVERGQEIARSNNTGSSGGPHLHFEIRREHESTKVCPDQYLTSPPVTPPLPEFPALPEAMTDGVRLNVREKPYVGARIWYVLNANERFGVMDAVVYQNGDVWLKIGHSEYCAMYHQSRLYVKFVETPGAVPRSLLQLFSCRGELENTL